MQVSNQALSLFDYIENKSKADETLNNLGQLQKNDVKDNYLALNQGLNDQEYEATLRRLEKGEINLDVNSVEHYFAFNLSKLEREVQSIREQFDISEDMAIEITDSSLNINDEEQSRLQTYLDKNDSLKALVNQTSRLSKFVEWAKAKEQAAEFKELGMEEQKLVEFLKDARKVVTESDHLLLGRNTFGFDSQGYSKSVIDKYTESAQTN